MKKQVAVLLSIGLFIFVSPLATSGYPSRVAQEIPSITHIKVNGQDYYPGIYTSALVSQLVDIQVFVNPVVDTEANRGYEGVVEIKLIWQHEDMSAGQTDINEKQYTAASTDIDSNNIFTIGPMDETSYPNNLGAGIISWYIELETDLNDKTYYPTLLPQSQAQIHYIAIGGETVTLPVDEPDPEPNPFLDDIIPEELQAIGRGVAEGLGSIAGNPFLLALLLGSGGVLILFIISGRQRRTKKGPVVPRTRKRKTKAKPFSISDIPRRFGRG